MWTYPQETGIYLLKNYLMEKNYLLNLSNSYDFPLSLMSQVLWILVAMSIIKIINTKAEEESSIMYQTLKSYALNFF